MTSTMKLSHLTTLTVFLILSLNILEAVQLKEVQLEETVELMCNISFYNDIYWLRMSEGQLMALMSTSLKHNGELSVVWNYNESHFEGFMEKQVTGLRIINVASSDLATYYCTTLVGKRLDFDKGVQLTVNTNQQQEECSDHIQASTGSFEGLSLHYQVFAAVLCLGLLGLFLAVSVVHMKTRGKENLQH